MNRRTALALAGTAALVLTTGTAAAAANLGILSTDRREPVGALDASAVSALAETSDPGFVVVDEIVPVPVPDTAVAAGAESDAGVDDQGTETDSGEVGKGAAPAVGSTGDGGAQAGPSSEANPTKVVTPPPAVASTTTTIHRSDDREDDHRDGEREHESEREDDD